MPMRIAHTTIGRIFTQRCFHLFVALPALVVIAQFLENAVGGRIIFSVIHLVVLVAAVAAIGRSMTSFVLALALALPAVIFQVWAIFFQDSAKLLLAWDFAAGFYVLALVYLLRYVFREDVITVDKLYGVAAAYLMP